MAVRGAEKSDGCQEAGEIGTIIAGTLVESKQINVMILP
jgi:hypothetical protein